MHSIGSRIFWRSLLGVALFTFTAAAAFGGATAVYHLEDPVTQGNWSSAYGGDGGFIANGFSNPPLYASASVTGGFTYTWAGATTDPRALTTTAIPRSGTASAFTNYQSTSFAINVNVVNGLSEVVAFYLLDWDTNNTRSETITVTDASTNALLDKRTFSSFSNGKYEVYQVTGNVTFTVTPANVISPVVSGVFFGFAATPTTPNKTNSAATYAGSDIYTQGNWKGVHGADGYSIVNDGFMAPTYATFSVNGAMTYTWAGLTDDVRALESAIQPAPARIASEYYQYQSKPFSINININDGGTHAISLYMLDWDTTSRIATVTITDLSTGVLLDMRSVGGPAPIPNFHNGTYYTWNIKGNVVITLTPPDSTTATVSGIFFENH